MIDPKGLLIGNYKLIYTDYGLLKEHTTFVRLNSNKSQSWHDDNVRAIGMLLDFYDVYGAIDDPFKLFLRFSEVLRNGTINESGHDPIGLYWPPRSIQVQQKTVSHINALSDFLIALNPSHKKINPLRKSTQYEDMLKWAAYCRSKNNSFLGHIKGQISDIGVSRLISVRHSLAPLTQSPKCFPKDKYTDFVTKGLKSKKPFIHLRNWMAVHLMHFAGLRESELCHLWVDDVIGIRDGRTIRANITLYHPEFGIDRFGRKRAKVLASYGLEPRNRHAEKRSTRAGFKQTVVDSATEQPNGYSSKIYFFGEGSDVLFWNLYSGYLNYLAILKPSHPYLFVNEDGSVMTLNNFNRQYRFAIKRIGLVPGKTFGTTPHAHRHSYKQALEDAGLPEKIIQLCLRHHSLRSQDEYGELSSERIYEMMNSAGHNFREHYASSEMLEIIGSL